MTTRRRMLGRGALALVLAILPLGPEAKPKKPGGGCTSTGTERRVGTDDQGQRVDCLWDTCVKTVCVEVGDRIRCGDQTSYSNPRDCKPAPKEAGTRPGLTTPAKPGRVLESR